MLFRIRHKPPLVPDNLEYNSLKEFVDLNMRIHNLICHVPVCICIKRWKCPFSIRDAIYVSFSNENWRLSHPLLQASPECALNYLNLPSSRSEHTHAKINQNAVYCHPIT